jgi:ElaB/YqjD/DUF883 family membrane-anchored ribosome-binding protein
LRPLAETKVMAANHDPSVEDLRRESERSRVALSNTVVELREKVSDTAAELKTRISPAHIKEEVKDYVREGSEQFFQSIGRKARENPLQAVAIGAGLAYPLWGLLRAIPAPIMLVGAGLWLAHQKSGYDGKSSVEHATAKAADLAAAAGAQVSGLVSTAQDAVSQGTTRIAEAASDAGAALSSKAGSVTEKVGVAAHDVRDSIAGMGQTVADSVTKMATNATNSATDAVSVVSDRAVQAGEQSRNAFVEMVDRNPLLVAGIGLAIGAFIAASLPPSDTENRMFGERSDDLKNKARQAASQVVEHAKDAAADMVGDVAAAAAREGLSVEGLNKAMGGLTEGVKSVVDHGMRTAMGEQVSPSPKNSTQPSKNERSQQ